MYKILTLSAIVFACVTGCSGVQFKEVLDKGVELSGNLNQNKQNQYGDAIKEALELSASRASNMLSAEGGYNNSALYRISLPENLTQAGKTLRRFGLDKQVDEVELRMNRGAEQAAIEAKGVFIAAIQAMTITDAIAIVRGDTTAATHYFREKTEADLRGRYLAVIKSNLDKVGFYSQYKRFLDIYSNIPIRDKPSLDLEQHALNQSLEGLFSQIAKEEIKIRQDPLGRGSSLLNTVFSK